MYGRCLAVCASATRCCGLALCLAVYQHATLSILYKLTRALHGACAIAARSMLLEIPLTSRRPRSRLNLPTLATHIEGDDASSKRVRTNVLVSRPTMLKGVGSVRRLTNSRSAPLSSADAVGAFGAGCPKTMMARCAPSSSSFRAADRVEPRKEVQRTGAVGAAFLWLLSFAETKESNLLSGNPRLEWSRKPLDPGSSLG
jgi:hypothetical protein